MTKNKKKILSLFKKRHALSAHDIRNAFSDMDSSTVYRNLERFCEDGLLREIATSGGRAYFEHASCTSSAHFVCDACHTVLPLAAKQVAMTHTPKGVHITRMHVVAHGACASCRRIHQ